MYECTLASTVKEHAPKKECDKMMARTSLSGCLEQQGVKKWNGTDPTVCDICHQPIEQFFIDGKTKMGPWACMCVSCHKTRGMGLGGGKGQKYEKKPEGWVKVEG